MYTLKVKVVSPQSCLQPCPFSMKQAICEFVTLGYGWHALCTSISSICHTNLNGHISPRQQLVLDPNTPCILDRPRQEYSCVRVSKQQYFKIWFGHRIAKTGWEAGSSWNDKVFSFWTAFHVAATGSFIDSLSPTLVDTKDWLSRLRHNILSHITSKSKLR